MTDVNTTIQKSVPTFWIVTMYNDDFTPITFVIEILRQIFGKSEHDAHFIAETIHQSGPGGKVVIGTYTKEMAVSKANYAMVAAKYANHPLLAIATEA